MLDYLRAASGYGVFVLAFFTIGLERLLPLFLKRLSTSGFDLSLSFGFRVVWTSVRRWNGCHDCSFGVD